MKVILSVLFCVSFLSTCIAQKIKKESVYISSCYLYAKPSVVLTLRTNNSFSYRLAYLQDEVTGTWKLRKDTLILTSKSFTDKNKDPLTPMKQITNHVGFDKLLFKGNKLFKLDLRLQKEIDCFLKRT